MYFRKNDAQSLYQTEEQALYAVSAIFSRRFSPEKRRNLAINIDSIVRGERPAASLSYSFDQIAALMYPNDDVKADNFGKRLLDAVAKKEFIPNLGENCIFLAELAGFPGLPPLSIDSPLRYWLPHAACASGWNLTKPGKFQNYTRPVYELLREFQDAGKNIPKAHDVLSEFKKNPPSEILEVMDGQGLKYYLKDGSVKTADLKAISGVIYKMTKNRPKVTD